jgi:hypothetical protein
MRDAADGVVERIVDWLRRYPQVRYEVTAGGILIHLVSANGFAVGLRRDEQDWIVTFDGQHDHFDEDEAAFQYVIGGLTGAYRLKVYARGNFVYTWIVEARHGDSWIEKSRTVIPIFPFWRKRQILYLQNDIERTLTL